MAFPPSLTFLNNSCAMEPLVQLRMNAFSTWPRSVAVHEDLDKLAHRFDGILAIVEDSDP